MCIYITYDYDFSRSHGMVFLPNILFCAITLSYGAFAHGIPWASHGDLGDFDQMVQPTATDSALGQNG